MASSGLLLRCGGSPSALVPDVGALRRRADVSALFAMG
jgi:hypothetical protein